ncbi:MAG: MerR family transcriptional regulator [Anaerolineae bacterium]|nr:MerR family transcriptional regulator [Anaerolineae bacterium]MCA9907617.1 MerR family transcriptional regulator [Anaerolineae bacterium]
MTTNDDTLTIQQVAETIGLSVHTLRYYERIGLIHPINRAANTHRRYTQDDVGWLAFLNKLRATGMSIRQMQAYAQLQRQGDGTLPERIEMLKTHQREVEAHMDVLREFLKLIGHKIDYYEGLLAEVEMTLEGS